MKYFTLSFLLALFLVSCTEEKPTTLVEEQEAPIEEQASMEKSNGFVRINSTLQKFNPIQPWDLNEPTYRRGLGALIEGGQIITTSEMVANAVFLEIESADGTFKEIAEVVFIDRESNLAILKPKLEEGQKSFIEELKPLTLSDNLLTGTSVEAWQLESNGQPVITEGVVNLVDVSRSYNGGKAFFTYLVKGSLQSSSNSFTLPIVKDGALVGLLTSYDSEEQISEVVASSVIKLFLEDTSDGQYDGFPSLGIAGSTVKDQAFRDWLGLDDEDGGLYITVISKGSAAEDAGIEIGDVLLTFDGNKLDRKGYYDDEKFGKLAWTHMIRGHHKVGETVKLEIKRDGKLIELSAVLKKAPEKLVPNEIRAEGNQYYVKGGVVIQQFTKNYLQAYGKEWSSRAPLNLLNIFRQPEEYGENMDEVVLLTMVIPSQLTVGYERVINSIIEEVNGVQIRKMSDLEGGFSQPKDGIHQIKISEAPYMIYLDAKGCDVVDQGLLSQGLPALKRIYDN